MLLASGDRQGAQWLWVILSIRVGAVQPLSVFSVMKIPLRRWKQKVLPSAEKVPKASHGRPVLQISPGAKTLAIGPGGICPRYGPLANGFPNTGMELIPKKATSQTNPFFVSFITNLLFLRAELVSNVIIPQKEICFRRKLSEMNKEFR